MNDLSNLEKKLGAKFNDENILWQAVTHRSYLNENPDWKLDHNERLEFLGDAVLELVVTDHLYHHYNLPEGELTNLRSAVVRGEMLSKIAEELEIDDFMLMSRGERKDTGKARQYILANAMEAVIGAVYLDSGYDAAKKLIDTYIVSKLAAVVEQGLHIDNKSRFQELAQEKFRVTPTYKVLSEAGLDHEKQFVVGAFLQDKKIGEGAGSSKQEAQQKAAKEALIQLDV
ncbi:MAG: ribonuclease III [Candidatus Andersenbacteria bacterium]|nr:ribonuclease III [Candidatus Andersenbacteria bacterium]MBI3250717.1 ribonuclease III [Candidatus Andersenbacteria bacterium]